MPFLAPSKGSKRRARESRFMEIKGRGMRLRLPAMGLMGLGVLLVVMFTRDLALGSVHIPPNHLLMILLGGEPERPSWRQIVLIFLVITDSVDRAPHRS